MVYVPAGEFEMGGDCGWFGDSPSDECPEHTVYLDAFWIDRTEVTVEAFERCVDAGKCSRPWRGHKCNWSVTGREKHPINGVNWNDAKAFCEWEGKRLPTEAEWEKAARGTDGRMYPWGDESASCERAVMTGEGGEGCGKNSTWAVGSRPYGASPHGLLDMAGNVWEWVADWYGPYPSDRVSNPRGPSDGEHRVLRGGSWVNGPERLRDTARHKEDPATSSNSVGFRCARSADRPGR